MGRKKLEDKEKGCQLPSLGFCTAAAMLTQLIAAMLACPEIRKTRTVNTLLWTGEGIMGPYLSLLVKDSGRGDTFYFRCVAMNEFTKSQRTDSKPWLHKWPCLNSMDHKTKQEAMNQEGKERDV